MNTVPQRPSNYRADIDGLRAIAVLSVVAYHIDESLVPGGFTGVDIFFVISGYLITQILQRDISSGRFSLAEFYRRRLLRIGPAYFAVTVATLCAGALILLPEDLRQLARSAGWSALAVPNAYFWLSLDTGYFAAASNQVPLLHLWSLGVEEQFYFLWPLSLMLMTRWLGWRSALLWFVGIIAFGSFLLGQYTATSAPSFAYYMLPARAGELLIGGLLALRHADTPTAPLLRSYTSEIQVVLGYALIACGLFVLDGDAIFPGFNALYPTLGAALIINAGTGSMPRASKVLRLRPLVFVGLISYSLYLWHWPILALMRYVATSLTTPMKISALAAMLIAAYASYRFVELPFRHGRPSKIIRRRPLVAYGMFVLVITGAALGLMRASDVRQAEMVAKHEAELAALKERMRAAYAYKYNCQRPTFEPGLVRHSRCLVGDADAVSRNAPSALLIGDSNAAHYIGVIGAIAEARGFAFRNLSVSSCPPLFGGGDKYGKKTDREGCSKYRSEIRKLSRKYPYVLLGAQWTSHSRISGFDDDLHATLEELGRSGATVILLGQVPRFRSFNQNCELSRLIDPNVTCGAADGDGVIPSINEQLIAVAAQYPHVHYMDVSDVICPAGACTPYIDEAPIYFDPGHLSMAGSWDVGRQMVSGSIPLEGVFRAMGSVDAATSAAGSSLSGN